MFVVAVGALLAGGLWLLTDDVLASGAMALGAIAIAAPVAGPQLIHGLAVFTLLLTGTSLTDSGLAPIATRVVAIGLVLLILAFKRRYADQASPQVLRFVAVIWMMLTLVSLVHGEGSGFVQATVGMGALLAFVVVPPRYFSGCEILWTWWWALAAYCLTSLALMQVLPSVAIENERLRGLADNANQLGVMALFLVVVAVLLQARLVVLLVTLGLVMPILALSGSRAAALGVVLALAVAALVGLRHARFTASVTLMAVGYVALQPELWRAISSAQLLRTNDSRAGSVAETARALDQSTSFGVGFEGLEGIVASSPLRALAVGGLLAAAFMVVAMLILIRSAAGKPEVRVLVTAALVHSFFEGWLVSTSGPIIISFAAIWVATLRITKEGMQDNDKGLLLAKHGEHSSRADDPPPGGPARLAGHRGARRGRVAREATSRLGGS